MNLKKIGAIAASALVMTSLAVSASAANLPGAGEGSVSLDPASIQAVDVDLSKIDATVWEGELVAIGPIDPATVSGGTTASKDASQGTAVYIEEADVDVSDIDLSNAQKGEPVAIGPIDSTTITGGTTTASKVANPETAIYITEADVDVSNIDLSNAQKGELVVIGPVNPATFTDGFTTQTAGK